MITLIRRAGAIAIMVACAAVSLLSAHAGAAKTAPRTLSADSVFVQLPHSVLEILSRSTRMDMLDYYRADSTYTATNLVDGTSELEMVTSDYLKVKLTDVSSMEIKILPLSKGGDIAGVSYTVNSTGTQADSQLFFFDSDLNPIPVKKVFSMPELKHFFKIDKGCHTSMKEIEEMVKFPTISFSFSPDNTSLTADLTVGGFMDPDDFNLIKIFMTGPLVYKWDGKQFRLR